MEQTAFTLQNARCLVIGAGRIGMLLARKLYALDAKVTVSARCTRDFARIAAAGLHALSLPGKVAPLSAARAVFDTVDTILHEEGIL